MIVIKVGLRAATVAVMLVTTSGSPLCTKNATTLIGPSSTLSPSVRLRFHVRRGRELGLLLCVAQAVSSVVEVWSVALGSEGVRGVGEPREEAGGGRVNNEAEVAVLRVYRAGKERR